MSDDDLLIFFGVESRSGEVVISAAAVIDDVDLSPPLAGHAGDCAKVTTATLKGTTDAPCSCGAEENKA